MEQKPTVGRIVHYHPTEAEKQQIGGGNTDADPLPAVIVRVWSDTCINLKVLTDGPNDLWITSAMLDGGAHTWEWPVR